jgi:hypothetical protein
MLVIISKGHLDSAERKALPEDEEHEVFAIEPFKFDDLLVLTKISSYPGRIVLNVDDKALLFLKGFCRGAGKTAFKLEKEGEQIKMVKI